MGDLSEIKSVIKSLLISAPGVMTIEKLTKDFYFQEAQSLPFRKFGYNSVEELLRSMPDITVSGRGIQAKLKVLRNEKASHIESYVKSQKKKKNPASRSAGNETYRNISHSNISYHTKMVSSKPNLYNFGYNNVTTMSHSEKNNLKGASTFYFSEKSSSQDSLEIYKSRNQASNCLNKPHEERSNNQIEEDSENKEHVTNSQDNSKIDLNGANRIYNPYISNCLNNSHKERSNFQIEKDSEENMEHARNSEDNSKIDLNSANEIFNPHIFDEMMEAIPTYAADGSVYQYDFPEGFVKPGQRIPNQNIPDDLQINSIIRIFITEVHNPFKFWFHKHSHDVVDAYDLTHKMQLFYSQLECDEYVIPLPCIKPGQICAATYENVWHRAEILQQVDLRNVKCFFVDFGTVDIVECRNIKFLHSSFADLPRQAMRGSVAFIEPINLSWTLEATKYFLSVVVDKMLFAKIREIDIENRVIYMVLCITLESTVFPINKNMVNEGHAKISLRWRDENIEKLGCRARHHRENFPTFDMLETGAYPSLIELQDMHYVGIFYENLYDIKYFQPSNISKIKFLEKYTKNLPFPLLTSNPFLFNILSELEAC